VRRTRKGDFEVKLPDAERDVLRSLPGQLRELLASDDPSVFRLFPSAYPDDPEREAEYSQLVRHELVEHHLASLDTLEQTLDETRLTEEQLLAWLGATNDLRLVLGTRLDVSEDMAEIPDDDPRAPAFAVYGYLTWLQEQLVEAIQS
jgi:hypothetical protein